MDRLAFEPRDYTAIVRDLLTTLTGGTVAEQAVVPVSGPVELTKLASRPFRRVSFLEGRYDAGGEERVIRFTEADFELADRDGDGMLDAIVFRPQGRSPIPGSIVSVNYYPVQLASPVPLTDLNVGSVIRTLLETVGRELHRIVVDRDDRAGDRRTSLRAEDDGVRHPVAVAIREFEVRLREADDTLLTAGVVPALQERDPPEGP